MEHMRMRAGPPLIFLFVLLVVARATGQPAEFGAEELAVEGRTLFEEQFDYRQAAAVYARAIELERASSSARPDSLAEWLGWLGGAYFRMGVFDTALTCYTEQQRLCRRTGNDRELAVATSNIGTVFHTLSRVDTAMVLYRRATALHRAAAHDTGIALGLNNIGLAWQHKGEEDSALCYFLQALPVAERAGYREGVALALSAIGALHYVRGAYDSAMTCYRRAVVMDQEPGARCATQCGIGNVHYSRGRYDSALVYYRHALDKADKHGLRTEQMRAVGNIGGVFAEQGQCDSALAYLERSAELARESGFTNGLGLKLGKIANVYRIRGQVDSARAYYRRALKADSLAGVTRWRGTHLLALARCDRECAAYDAAAGHALKALRWARSRGQAREEASALVAVGHVYEKRGAHDSACVYYEQALAMARRLGSKALTVEALTALGDLYRVQDAYDTAVTLLAEAYSLEHAMGRRNGMARVLLYMGNAYRDWSRYDSALAAYRQALRTHREEGDRIGAATALGGIGDVYRSTGDTDSAIVYYRQALRINRELGRRGGAAANQADLARVYLALEQCDSALACSRRSQHMRRAIGDSLAVLRGQHLVARALECKGLFDSAEAHLRAAAEMAHGLGLLNEERIARANLGNLLVNRADYDGAIESYERAVSYAREIGTLDQLGTMHHNYGVVYQLAGQDSAAIANLCAAVVIRDELCRGADGDLRRDYLASELLTRAWLVKAYAGARQWEPALEANELRRARLLSEPPSDGEQAETTADESGLGWRPDRNAAAVVYANSGWHEPVVIVRTHDTCVGIQLPIRAALTSVMARFGDAISRANDGRATADAERKRTCLDSLIAYYRLLLNGSPNGDADTLADVARALHRALVGPIASHLAAVERIVVVPDGVLSLVPFETLRDDNGVLLAQRYHVSYAQSLRMLAELNDRGYGQRRRTVLAFGGAVYGDSAQGNGGGNTQWTQRHERDTRAALARGMSVRNAFESLGRASWADMPLSVAEARAIARLGRGSRCVVGTNVNEGALKRMSNRGALEEYRAVHFATHGLVVPHLPRLSGLVLSPERSAKGGEDGYLTCPEIGRLRLRADVAVLSACEAGLVWECRGESVAGLVQAFTRAGAKAVTLSLWPVVDESTVQFMTGVYRLALTSAMSFSDALSYVKRRFIAGYHGERYRHPRFWAPFVYYGALNALLGGEGRRSRGELSVPNPQLPVTDIVEPHR